MGAMMGLLNHSLSSVQSLTSAGAQGKTAAAGAGASPMATGTGGTGSSSDSGSSATISANDFLSLLVTEMKNQDPTADTDPNEYINQLVQVNSLEQLIDINQNLSTALGGSSSTSGTASGGDTSSGAAPGKGVTASGLTASGPVAAAGHGVAAPPATDSSDPAAAIRRFSQSVSGKPAPGNLAVPAVQPASKTVAHALDGHGHGGPTRGQIPGTP